MTTLLIILALWLIPGIIGYMIASSVSRHWKWDGEDFVLFIPVVNILALGLILLICIDEKLSKGV